MKKMTLWAISGVAVLSLFGADAPKKMMGPDGKMYEVKTVDPGRLQRAIYKNTGGKLLKPGTAKGKIVFVNAQKSAPREWIEKNAASFRGATKLTIEVEDGTFALPSPKISGQASLFVVDDAALPPLLLAPENRWAMVNVAPLKRGAGEKEAFFGARVQKELARGFCLLTGAQDSRYPNSLIGCITDTERLDDFTDNRMPIDVLARIKGYVKGYGLEPAEETTYRKACHEGWAPEPKDDIQRKIWNQVKNGQADATDPTNRWKRDFPGKK